MVVIERKLAVQFVCAGLGKDFNPAKAHAVILRGKWILVDANFTNGRLRRKLASGKAININLPAIGTGGRPGQRLKF